MAGERRLRILNRLVGTGAPELETRRLCEVCAEVTDMTGAGLMLMSGDVPRGAVCTTNDVSAHIEQWQDAFGEGPCVDAYREDRPVLESNLSNPVTSRWLAFAPPAVEAGVRAVFVFPLQVGSIRLGALNLYRDRPGPLTEEQYADALVMADVAAQALLALQANAPPGQLAVELEACSDFQTVVHQASGMVAAQLDVSVAQAVIRLRAHAFGNDFPLAQVAEAVVARNLRFDASNGEIDLVPRG